jgi:hypothetical protein
VVREMLQGMCLKNWVTAGILYIYIYKKGNSSKGNEILWHQFLGTVNTLHVISHILMRQSLKLAILPWVSLLGVQGESFPLSNPVLKS